MINYLFMGLILIICYLICMFILVQIKHDTSIANFTWGGGVLLISLYTLLIYSDYSHRQILITTLIVLWAVRLIIYLYLRYTGHDPRFEKWKLQGIRALIFNLIWIFLGQLSLLIIMSIPSFLVNTLINKQLNFFDYLGIIIWIFGYCFESISDYQLYKFLKIPTNKGHVMKYGLWKYSRHPNYFGEILMWWGIFLIACNVSIFSIIAPITITVLLCFVTGVPLLENSMKNNIEYQEYKKHTNILIPWFQK